MTREEIVNEIKQILEELNYPDAVSYLTQNDRGWLEENIRALEQEPKTDVIGKIRAEIVEDIEKYNDIYDDTCHGLRMALDIIDKYTKGIT